MLKLSPSSNFTPVQAQNPPKKPEREDPAVTFPRSLVKKFLAHDFFTSSIDCIELRNKISQLKEVELLKPFHTLFTCALRLNNQGVAAANREYLTALDRVRLNAYEKTLIELIDYLQKTDNQPLALELKKFQIEKFNPVKMFLAKEIGNEAHRQKVFYQAAQQGKLQQKKTSDIRSLERGLPILYKNGQVSVNYVSLLDKIAIKGFTQFHHLEEELLAGEIANFYSKDGTLTAKKYARLETPALLKQEHDQEEQKTQAEMEDQRRLTIQFPLASSDLRSILHKLKFISQFLTTNEEVEVLYSMITLEKIHALSNQVLKEIAATLFKDEFDTLDVKSKKLALELAQHYLLSQTEKIKPKPLSEADHAKIAESYPLPLNPHSPPPLSDWSFLLQSIKPIRSYLDTPQQNKLLHALAESGKLFTSATNGLSFVPIPNKNENPYYVYCKKTHWKILNENHKWVAVDFRKIHQLWLEEKIDKDTLQKIIRAPKDPEAVKYLVKVLNVKLAAVNPYIFSFKGHKIHSSERSLKKHLHEINRQIQLVGVEPHEEALYAKYKEQAWNYMDSFGQVHKNKKFIDLYLAYQRGELNFGGYLLVPDKNGDPCGTSVQTYDRGDLASILEKKSVLYLSDPLRITSKNSPHLYRRDQRALIPKIIQLPLMHYPAENTIVKPYIENLKIFANLSEVEKSMILDRLDEESIFRGLLTISLQTLDLHLNNVGFSPLQKQTYRHFEDIDFSITDRDGQLVHSRLNLPDDYLSLSMIQLLDYFGRLNEDMRICFAYYDENSKAQMAMIPYADLDKTDLGKAIRTPWKLELFDMDHSMKENNVLVHSPYSGPVANNKDPMAHFDVLVPFRSVLLGTKWGEKALPEAIVDRLIDVKARDSVFHWLNRMDAPIRRLLTQDQNKEVKRLLTPLLERDRYNQYIWRKDGQTPSMEALRNLFVKEISAFDAKDKEITALWHYLDACFRENASARKKTRSPYFYEIQEGDTLAGIAQKTGLSESALREYNPTLHLQPSAKIRLGPDLTAISHGGSQSARKVIAKQLFPRASWSQCAAYAQRLRRQQRYLSDYRKLAHATETTRMDRLEKILYGNAHPLTSEQSNDLRTRLAEFQSTKYESEQLAGEALCKIAEDTLKLTQPSYTNLAKATYPVLADTMEFIELYYGKKEIGNEIGNLKISLKTMLVHCLGLKESNSLLYTKALHLEQTIKSFIMRDSIKGGPRQTPGYWVRSITK